MRSPRAGRLSNLLAATALTLLTTTSLGWGTALAADSKLTPAQEQSIKDEMAVLGKILVDGGKSPQDARLATNAVGICLGAAYSQGLTRAEADKVCGLVLDAYMIPAGSVAYQLTPDDKAWITSRVGMWTEELKAVLSPDELGAVRSTMQACLEGYMRQGKSRGDAVESCAMGLLPLLNEPDLRQRLVTAAGKAR